MVFVVFQMTDLDLVFLINNNDSGLTKINCGILQGPVLGPLHFIYISMTLIKL